MKTTQRARDELRKLLVGSPFAVHVNGKVLTAMLDDLDELASEKVARNQKADREGR